MIFDNTTIDLFKHVVRMDGFMKLPAEGNSMFPLIRKGDICQFVTCEPTTLIKGDIVLFHSESGQLIAHRFSHTKKLKNVQRYFFKGDTNLGYDHPVTEYQIIGKLSFIQKANKQFSMENIAAELWGKLILTVPAISGMLRKYLNWKSPYQF
jgi:signal peptidase I